MTERSTIQSSGAPAAIGPYSPAVKAGSFLFLSGQIPLDAGTGQIVNGDITAQTEQVMRNLSALLEAAGASFTHVVKTTIYLVDLGDFAEVNTAYSRFVGDPAPARVTVQVAALPRGARVEIDAVAVL